MASLTGKIALVTGSTSGIGLGIAHALAAAGADIVIHGFAKPGEGDELAGTIATKYSIRTAFFDHDLASGQAASELVHAAAAKLGALDILVNCAGIQHISIVEDFPDNQWWVVLRVSSRAGVQLSSRRVSVHSTPRREKVIAINLSAAFYTCKAALPAMKAKGYGRVINIASVHGLVASANKSAYVTAKHGLVGFTKALALENAGTGVTANAICPGWVWTPLVERQVQLRAEQKGLSFEAAKKDLLLEKQPSGEFATPEQIGALCVFLCSAAAAQMTGSPVLMDGGWTAQ